MRCCFHSNFYSADTKTTKEKGYFMKSIKNNKNKTSKTFLMFECKNKLGLDFRKE